MTSKRPSYLSIRARQRNIIEGIGTRDIKYAQAAKEFGVTRTELKRFIETKPKDLRKSYNRSPSIRKLYEEGERSETRKALGVKRIKRYEFRENVLRPLYKDPQKVSDIQIGHMVQRLYYENNIATQMWAVYVRENDLPTSIDEIRRRYRAGRMSSVTYNTAIKTWAKIYNIKPNRLAEYEIDPEDWFNEEATG